MVVSNKLILLTPLTGAALDRFMTPFRDLAEIVVITEHDKLIDETFSKSTTLICFGSGIIIPPNILSRLHRPAYNLHAASPEFPGRDPHHHAIYRAAAQYGATLHLIAAKVDAGPIVGVEYFQVETQATPESLLHAANEAGMRLIERFGPRLLDCDPLPFLREVAWGKVKTARRDFIALSQISPLISQDEFARRYRAFDGGAYNNLTVSMHGHTFRIEKSKSLFVTNNTQFAHFTESAFRGLLRQLKTAAYRFASYGEQAEDRHVIWRHDIDFSVHRALRLAEIEAKEDVAATYFVNPRSFFYNILEPEIANRLRQIRALGHELGLHFDGASQGENHWTKDILLSAIEQEKTLINLILGEDIKAISWHNPDQSNLLDFGDEMLAGLWNAYSEKLRRNYTYTSDSNGYWRFKSISDVIAEGHMRLHLLTHPEWWTPEPMPPSDRIDRAILGRARAVRAAYDEGLQQAGRRNMT